MEVLKQPLSNVQLELLKTFSHQLSESEILDLRKVLAQFFAQRAIQIANEVWEEKGWGDEDVDRMLDTKMRKKTN
jgi:F0F1-type ATP synthase delta subunit